jgi:hypothetical protein
MLGLMTSVWEKIFWKSDVWCLVLWKNFYFDFVRNLFPHERNLPYKVLTKNREGSLGRTVTDTSFGLAAPGLYFLLTISFFYLELFKVLMVLIYVYMEEFLYPKDCINGSFFFHFSCYCSFSVLYCTMCISLLLLHVATRFERELSLLTS